jgi:hypothetical protein
MPHSGLQDDDDRKLYELLNTILNDLLYTHVLHQNGPISPRSAQIFAHNCFFFGFLAAFAAVGGDSDDIQTTVAAASEQATAKLRELEADGTITTSRGTH